MQNTGGGIIIKNHRILLTKRGIKVSTYPGYWTIPSGRGEEGESPEQIAIREVKEEIGLEFIPTLLFHSSIIEHSGKNMKTHRFLGNFSGTIVLQEEEVDGYAWFSYAEAMELQLAFDYRHMIELLHEQNILA